MSWYIRLLFIVFFKKEGWGVGKSIVLFIFILNDLFRLSVRKSGYLWSGWDCKVSWV